jgi:ribonuclease BN (tRNA processing enzyme)
MVMFGSAGWIPSQKRDTMCAAVELGKNLFILDAGTGMRRFRGRIGQALLKNHDTISIFLSHYHLDHIIGISYLPQNFTNKRIRIYAPRIGANGENPERVLARLFDPPIFFPLPGFPCSIEIETLDPGRHEIDGVTVSVFKQSHTVPSVAYRIEDLVYYATDRLPTRDLVTHAKGVQYLFHDASFDEAELATIRDPKKRREALWGHSTAQDAGRLARDAGVGHLGLVHLSPSMEEAEYRSLKERVCKIFPNTFLPQDGRWIYFD